MDHPPENYPDRSLVRFRCMIQDTSASPEMYLCRTSSGECTGWGLTAASSPSQEDEIGDINYSDLRDCSVVWAVSVPGENSWWKEHLDKHEGITSAYFALSLYIYISRPAAIDDATSAPGSVNVHKPTRPYKHPISQQPHVGVQVKVCTSQRIDLPLYLTASFQIYGNLGNEAPKTCDVMNLVGILTSEPYVVPLGLHPYV